MFLTDRRFMIAVAVGLGCLIAVAAARRDDTAAGKAPRPAASATAKAPAAPRGHPVRESPDHVAGAFDDR